MCHMLRWVEVKKQRKIGVVQVKISLALDPKSVRTDGSKQNLSLAACALHTCVSAAANTITSVTVASTPACARNTSMARVRNEV
jgi:hypothetical protein